MTTEQAVIAAILCGAENASIEAHALSTLSGSNESNALNVLRAIGRNADESTRDKPFFGNTPASHAFESCNHYVRYTQHTDLGEIFHDAYKVIAAELVAMKQIDASLSLLDVDLYL